MIAEIKTVKTIVFKIKNRSTQIFNFPIQNGEKQCNIIFDQSCPPSGLASCMNSANVSLFNKSLFKIYEL